MKIKNTKLLFLYRSPLFKNIYFTTDKKELNTIVTALNIKTQKERIEYIYEEGLKVIKKYYSKDLCQFINGRCIVQRNDPTNKHVNGCCLRCPICGSKGCPSENIACKLIYCKTALNNMKTLKYKDIKILKCLPITKRLILQANFFITKEEIIDDMDKGIIVWIFRVIKRKLFTK